MYLSYFRASKNTGLSVWCIFGYLNFRKLVKYMKFEFFMTMTMDNAAVWDVTPFSAVDI